MRAVKLPSQAISANVLQGYAFALAAAISWGAAPVLVRHAVAEQSMSPMVGSAVALAWATLFVLVLQPRGLEWKGPAALKGALLFTASGIAGSLGFTIFNIALSKAPVVIVSPVSSIHPLFALVIAALLLRGMERVTPRLFLGAMLVVAGVGLLTVAQALD